MGVGEGEVCYSWTRPGTPKFRPNRNEVLSPRRPGPAWGVTGPGMGDGGGRGLLQLDPARHSRTETRSRLSTNRAWRGGGGGRGLLQLDVHSLDGLTNRKTGLVRVHGWQGTRSH